MKEVNVFLIHLYNKLVGKKDKIKYRKYKSISVYHFNEIIKFDQMLSLGSRGK